MKNVSLLLAAVALLLASVSSSYSQQQGRGGGGGGQGQGGGQGDGAQDPGPRGDPQGAGQFLNIVNPSVLAEAQDGQIRFSEQETFSSGLGPYYNSGVSGACSECHAQPASGGGSPSASIYPNVGPNPQATVDFNADGATNIIPPFVTANGPVREMRLKYFHNSDGSLNYNAPDGGVHDLFTVTGRSDAPGCSLSQPNFQQELALGNAIFRTPLPVFGDGLIENIDDGTIEANQAANAAAKAALGISGFPNRSGNDGTITRFGWKAQNKSLLMFAGEAYNVEVGVSNELFPTQRATPGGPPLPSGCLTNGTPEDQSNPGQIGPAVNSDITAFAAFMRMLAPPAPIPLTASAQRGQATFSAIGCALCHTPSMVTSTSGIDPSLSNVTANLFSDLLVHNMGANLSDGVTQGAASGNYFRTTPLWGLGQRIFFLHDGRTTDLQQAIFAHGGPGSEANAVTFQYGQLSANQKQDLLNFLRSL